MKTEIILFKCEKKLKTKIQKAARDEDISSWIRDACRQKLDKSGIFSMEDIEELIDATLGKDTVVGRKVIGMFKGD